MASHVDRQRIGVRTLAPGEHIAHLVDAHTHARSIAPALEKVPALAVFVGQCLSIVAARDAGADLGHFHQAVPQPVAVDPHIRRWLAHAFNSPLNPVWRAS